jgi:hypothetical protein
VESLCSVSTGQVPRGEARGERWITCAPVRGFNSARASHRPRAWVVQLPLVIRTVLPLTTAPLPNAPHQTPTTATSRADCGPCNVDSARVHTHGKCAADCPFPSQPYSIDLRGRVIEEVASGASRREAAERPPTDFHIFGSEHGFMALFPLAKGHFRRIADNPIHGRHKGEPRPMVSPAANPWPLVALARHIEPSLRRTGL